jgi:hypothetical protein
VPAEASCCKIHHYDASMRWIVHLSSESSTRRRLTAPPTGGGHVEQVPGRAAIRMPATVLQLVHHLGGRYRW